MSSDSESSRRYNSDAEYSSDSSSDSDNEENPITVEDNDKLFNIKKEVDKENEIYYDIKQSESMSIIEKNREIKEWTSRVNALIDNYNLILKKYTSDLVEKLDPDNYYIEPEKIYLNFPEYSDFFLDKDNYEKCKCCNPYKLENESYTGCNNDNCIQNCMGYYKKLYIKKQDNSKEKILKYLSYNNNHNKINDMITSEAMPYILSLNKLGAIYSNAKINRDNYVTEINNLILKGKIKEADMDTIYNILEVKHNKVIEAAKEYNKLAKEYGIDEIITPSVDTLKNKTTISDSDSDSDYDYPKYDEYFGNESEYNKCKCCHKRKDNQKIECKQPCIDSCRNYYQKVIARAKFNKDYKDIEPMMIDYIKKNNVLNQYSYVLNDFWEPYKSMTVIMKEYNRLLDERENFVKNQNIKFKEKLDKKENITDEEVKEANDTITGISEKLEKLAIEYNKIGPNYNTDILKVPSWKNKLYK